MHALEFRGFKDFRVARTSSRRACEAAHGIAHELVSAHQYTQFVMIKRQRHRVPRLWWASSPPRERQQHTPRSQPPRTQHKRLQQGWLR